jgi:hypothetical protein
MSAFRLWLARILCAVLRLVATTEEGYAAYHRLKK